MVILICGVTITSFRLWVLNSGTWTIGRAKPAVEGPEAAPPRLLNRVDPQLRAELIRVSVRDHYVEVFTERGKDTLLMRFSDAVAELAGEEGLQVHRSHWVAARAVTGAERSRGRLFLLLSDGSKVPVSRGFQAAVAARGLI